MSGGQTAVPLHDPRHRAAGDRSFGTQHSATGESWYLQVAGLRGRDGELAGGGVRPPPDRDPVG
jgi:hypothetical protein